MTQSFYRKPKIGAGRQEEGSPLSEPQPLASRKHGAFGGAAKHPSTAPDSGTSYPQRWLKAPGRDSPSSYPQFRGTYIPGSPCSGTYHSIN